MHDEIDALLRDHARRWSAAQPDDPDALPVVGAVRGPDSRNGRPPTTRLVAAVAACLVVAAAAAFGIRRIGLPGPADVATAPTASASTRDASTTTLPDEARLAPGVRAVTSSAELYDAQLLTVPGEDGVWAIGAVSPRPSGQGTTAAIWHAAIWRYDDTSGHTSRWTVELRHTRGLPPAPFAACRSRAWVGDGTTLVELDPASGAVKRLTVPTVRGIDGQRRSEVTAIACSDSPDAVVLTLAHGAEYLVYSPRTGRYVANPLPSGMVATSAQFASSGDLGLSLLPDAESAVASEVWPGAVLVVDGATGGTRTVAVKDERGLLARGTAFFLADGESIGPGSTESSPPRFAADAAAGVVHRPLAHGRFLRVSRSSLSVVDSSSPGPPVVLQLGSHTCPPPFAPVGREWGPSGAPAPSPTTTAARGRCGITPPTGRPSTFRLLSSAAVDDAGTAYALVPLDYEWALLRVPLD